MKELEELSHAVAVGPVPPHLVVDVLAALADRVQGAQSGAAAVSLGNELREWALENYPTKAEEQPPQPAPGRPPSATRKAKTPTP